MLVLCGNTRRHTSTVINSLITAIKAETTEGRLFAVRLHDLAGRKVV